MRMLFWCSLFVSMVYLYDASIDPVGSINNVMVFSSTEKNSQLFILPSILIDPVAQTEWSTGFETIQITIPIIVEELNDEMRMKVLTFYRNEKKDLTDYTVQPLPLRYIRLMWKNDTSFAHDDILHSNWQQLDLDQKNTNFSIILNCKSIEKCHLLLSQMREDPNFLGKNLLLMYSTDKGHYEPVNIMITTSHLRRTHLYTQFLHQNHHFNYITSNLMQLLLKQVIQQVYNDMNNTIIFSLATEDTLKERLKLKLAQDYLIFDENTSNHQWMQLLDNEQNPPLHQLLAVLNQHRKSRISTVKYDPYVNQANRSIEDKLQTYVEQLFDVQGQQLFESNQHRLQFDADSNTLSLNPVLVLQLDMSMFKGYKRLVNVLQNATRLRNIRTIPFQSRMVSDTNNESATEYLDIGSKHKEIPATKTRTKRSISDKSQDLVFEDKDVSEDDAEDCVEIYESEDPTDTTTQGDFTEESDEDSDESASDNSVDITTQAGFSEEPDEDSDESESKKPVETTTQEDFSEEPDEDSDESESEKPVETTTPKDFSEEPDEDSNESESEKPVETTTQKDFSEEPDEDSDESESEKPVDTTTQEDFIEEPDEDSNESESEKPVDTTTLGDFSEEPDEDSNESESEKPVDTTTQRDFSEEPEEESGRDESNNSHSTESQGNVTQGSDVDSKYSESDDSTDETVNDNNGKMNPDVSDDKESTEHEIEGSITSSAVTITEQTVFRTRNYNQETSLAPSSKTTSTVTSKVSISEQTESIPTSVARGWDQCGGLEWKGSKTCESGFDCFARSIWYSQCRPQNRCPLGWACNHMSSSNDPVPPPSIIPAYHPCNTNFYGECQDGTYCFRRTTALSVCVPTCPSTWDCQKDFVPEYGQCGGTDYIGSTQCANGLTCFKKNEWYSNCHKTCPNDINYDCAKNRKTQ